MEARPLPPRPNLEQYKKQAKDLLKACAFARHRVLFIRGPNRWFEAYADQCVETEARLRGFGVTQKSGASIRREHVDAHREKHPGGYAFKARFEARRCTIFHCPRTRI